VADTPKWRDYGGELRPRLPLNNAPCFICGQIGHISGTCDGEEQAVVRQMGRCFGCGGVRKYIACSREHSHITEHARVVCPTPGGRPFPKWPCDECGHFHWRIDTICGTGPTERFPDGCVYASKVAKVVCCLRCGGFGECKQAKTVR